MCGRCGGAWLILTVREQKQTDSKACLVVVAVFVQYLDTADDDDDDASSVKQLNDDNNCNIKM